MGHSGYKGHIMTEDKSLELQSCKNRGRGGVVQIYDGYLLT